MKWKQYCNKFNKDFKSGPHQKKKNLKKKKKNLYAMQETQVPSLGWEDPWRMEWQPTSVLLPGESQGQRSLAGYCPWGFEESNMIEAT